MPNTILPPLDRDSIKAQQEAAVAAELQALTDPAERLRVAAEIVNTAQAEFERLRPRRDSYAMSLWAHDGVRALNRVIGVNRTRWYEVRGEADQSAVKHIKTAADKLPRLAADTAAAEERARAGRAARDEAIGELLTLGWGRPEIAAIIGRNPSRVSHIKSRAAVA